MQTFVSIAERMKKSSSKFIDATLFKNANSQLNVTLALETVSRYWILYAHVAA